jgi:hypothetical protein
MSVGERLTPAADLERLLDAAAHAQNRAVHVEVIERGP